MEWIDLNTPLIDGILDILLQDKSSGENILFATDDYDGLGARDQITREALTRSGGLRPRCVKSRDEQFARTRSNAEVFTPCWVVNKMNNYLDEDWFGREAVFNRADGQTWHVNAEKIGFPEGMDWQAYVDSRRLEITCGEAPYLVSRYDAADGSPIEISRRVRILDRKLRVVNENCETEAEWLTWARRALESVYGYELQGDNLLIARLNLWLSVAEYLRARWGREPNAAEAEEFGTLICWNLWQMDGLTRTLPFAERRESEPFNLSFLEQTTLTETPADCRVNDWRGGRTILFREISRRGGKSEGSESMKFDYVIGNPPYQETQNSTDIDESLKNYAPPIYHLMIDSAFEIANKVELIHPARFLFNAGSTPSAWNTKMLNDTHFCVLHYYENCKDVFPSTDIKGGIAITYRDVTKNYGAIKTFSNFPEVNKILHKVTSHSSYVSIDDIVFSRTSFRLTERVHVDYPEAHKYLSDGHLYDMSSNIFQRLPFLFFSEKPNDGRNYIKIIGRYENNRVYRYILANYINEGKNLNHYKVFIPQAGGTGKFGETIGIPVIAGQGVASTETFLSIGKFDTQAEAERLEKYIRTKFFRCLLSVLKVTQIANKPVYKYIPLQDFSEHSDIDWSMSVANIDKQLYRKYGLSAEEIDFIETHVKEMA